MAKVTVDGIEVEVPSRRHRAAGLRGRGQGNPALLLPRAPVASPAIAACAWSRWSRPPKPQSRPAPCRSMDGMKVFTDTPMVQKGAAKG